MVYHDVDGISISFVRGAAGRESTGLYILRARGSKIAEYGLTLPSGRREWVVTWGRYKGLTAPTVYDLESLIVMNVKRDLAGRKANEGNCSGDP